MDYLRRYMLLEAYKAMTDEERRFLCSQDEQRRHSEVMGELTRIKSQGSFGIDFVSNIAGNATWDAAVWLAKKLIKHLR